MTTLYYANTSATCHRCGLPDVEGSSARGYCAINLLRKGIRSIPSMLWIRSCGRSFYSQCRAVSLLTKGIFTVSSLWWIHRYGRCIISWNSTFNHLTKKVFSIPTRHEIVATVHSFRTLSTEPILKREAAKRNLEIVEFSSTSDKTAQYMTITLKAYDIYMNALNYLVSIFVTTGEFQVEAKLSPKHELPAKCTWLTRKRRKIGDYVGSCLLVHSDNGITK